MYYKVTLANALIPYLFFRIGESVCSTILPKSDFPIAKGCNHLVLRANRTSLKVKNILGSANFPMLWDERCPAKSRLVGRWYTVVANSFRNLRQH